jgi:hypothetical protein
MCRPVFPVRAEDEGSPDRKGDTDGRSRRALRRDSRWGHPHRHAQPGARVAAGAPLATIEIPNDAAGFAAALAWIGEHAPGPRVLVALEGTRSHGVGLTRGPSAASVLPDRSPGGRSRASSAIRALAANKNELAASVAIVAPQLLAQPGIGPVCAAQAIVSWSHAGRCRDDAAFAALAGASPLEASSGT